MVHGPTPRLTPRLTVRAFGQAPGCFSAHGVAWFLKPWTLSHSPQDMRTDHGSMANGVMALMALMTAIAHSHALPCCHVLCLMHTAPLPSSLSPSLPPSSQIHPAFTLSRYPVPLSLPTALPLHPASPAGRFTHRVPQTGSNARLGFPLINTHRP